MSVAPVPPVASFWSKALAFLLTIFGTVGHTVVGWLSPPDYLQLLVKVGLVLAGNLALWLAGGFGVLTATIVAGVVILATQVLSGFFPGVFKAAGPPSQFVD